jgi:hypothetical protein
VIPHFSRDAIPYTSKRQNDPVLAARQAIFIIRNVGFVQSRAAAIRQECDE